MQIETKCKACGKTFNKHIEVNSGHHDHSKDTCYTCALESLTGGCAPEEGDFNSARIISGEMSDDENKELRDELRKVDWAACQPDPDDDIDDRSQFDEDGRY